MHIVKAINCKLLVIIRLTNHLIITGSKINSVIASIGLVICTINNYYFIYPRLDKSTVEFIIVIIRFHNLSLFHLVPELYKIFLLLLVLMFTHIK